MIKPIPLQAQSQQISLEEVKSVPFQHWFQSEATENNLFRLFLKF